MQVHSWLSTCPLHTTHHHHTGKQDTGIPLHIHQQFATTCAIHYLLETCSPHTTQARTPAKSHKPRADSVGKRMCPQLVIPLVPTPMSHTINGHPLWQHGHKFKMSGLVPNAAGDVQTQGVEIVDIYIYIYMPLIPSTYHCIDYNQIYLHLLQVYAIHAGIITTDCSTVNRWQDEQTQPPPPVGG